MNKQTKFFVKYIFILLSFFIYWWLESGFSLQEGNEIVKSVIFALSTYLAYNIKLKRLLLWLVCILFFLTLVFYLFWQLQQANFFGSIGFGMMIIFIVSFVPEFLKKGYTENL